MTECIAIPQSVNSERGIAFQKSHPPSIFGPVHNTRDFLNIPQESVQKNAFQAHNSLPRDKFDLCVL